MNKEQPQSPSLERKLGTWACISIVVGSVIGSSIFMKPATMAGQLGSPVLLLAVWLGAGIISLFGGMINAEVGSILPQTGGQYTYFRYMYGDFFAFLSGWAAFIVINTASVASIAYIFAQYSSYFLELPRFSEGTEQSWTIYLPFIGTFFPLEHIGVKALAIAVILLFTMLNYFSLKAGGSFQVFFTVLKVLVLLLLIVSVFSSGKGDLSFFVRHGDSDPLEGWALVAGMIAATSGALAAYDGWNNLGMVAGEIRDPQRNITRGLFIGLGICIFLYVLTNQAYLYILGIEGMRGSSLVASDALAAVWGGPGTAMVALLVMISTIGAVNGNILPVSRMTYAMGTQRHFFSWVGKVHPRHHTPGNALWLHGVWSSLFVLTGTFDMLTDLFVFVTWIFYGFAGYGIFILRKKLPKVPRSYKVWGFPYVPVIFIGFSVFYFIITIYNDVLRYLQGSSKVINSLLGLFLLLIGVPVYWYLRRGRGNAFSERA